jgi:hypothetical protein
MLAPGPIYETERMMLVLTGCTPTQEAISGAALGGGVPGYAVGDLLVGYLTNADAPMRKPPSPRAGFLFYEILLISLNSSGSGGSGFSTFLITEHPETTRATASNVIAAFTLTSYLGFHDR